MNEDATPRIRVLIAAVLVVATLVVYWPVRLHEFIHYDDNAYLWMNGQVDKGLTLEGVKWAFTTVQVCNWHPLTWLSHMLDCSLFSLSNPGGHHMMSVGFHVLNTVLLFVILHFMTKKAWRSAIVAALFALHPLHVESVAWVAERKDVLSTLFGLIAIWSYALYAQRMKWSWYACSLLAFALSLLSKPMLVTLPCVLLLLDVWPLGRTRIMAAADGVLDSVRVGVMRLATEKIPFLLLSIASSIVTVYAQKVGGAVYSIELLPMSQRIANALAAYGKYLQNMVWPMDLALIYPLPKESPVAAAMIALIVLLFVSAIAIVFRRSRPWLLIGWLWYLGTLVPVIGLLQVGLQSMADRYTYVPLIGVFIMLAWSLPNLARLSRGQCGALATVTLIILGVLGWMTRMQIAHWRDSESLFSRAVEVTDGNYIAHNLLGTALEFRGDLDGAIGQYAKAIELHYRFPAAHTNLGNALLKKKEYPQAISELRISLRMQPESWLTRQNLGAALVETGAFVEATSLFQSAIQLKSDLYEARLGLARSLRALNRVDEAIPEFEAALRLNAASVDAMLGLGACYAAKERLDEATGLFQRAMEREPENPDAHVSAGIVMATKGQYDDAIERFREALRLNPAHAEAQRYMTMAMRFKEDQKPK